MSRKKKDGASTLTEVPRKLVEHSLLHMHENQLAASVSSFTESNKCPNVSTITFG
jgi:hypothetical protein